MGRSTSLGDRPQLLPRVDPLGLKIPRALPCLPMIRDMFALSSRSSPLPKVSLNDALGVGIDGSTIDRPLVDRSSEASGAFEHPVPFDIRSRPGVSRVSRGGIARAIARANERTRTLDRGHAPWTDHPARAAVPSSVGASMRSTSADSTRGPSRGNKKTREKIPSTSRVTSTDATVETASTRSVETASVVASRRGMLARAVIGTIIARAPWSSSSHRRRASTRAVRAVAMRGVKKENLPEKTCVVCERAFTWRKKWENCWDEVTTCSKSCNAKRKSEKQKANAQARASEGDDGGSESGERRERAKHKAKVKAQKAERRARLEFNGDPTSGQKPCDECEKMVNELIRCQTDATKRWRMVCGKCWVQVSGGVVDGDAEHPHYRYGGLWKNRRAQQSGESGIEPVPA